MAGMIVIRDLVKRFGPLTAVDGISFSVNRGEVLGFLGPNGAGKSTTMKVATGFLVPTSGSVEIAGFDVTRDPIEAKRRIGYLPEGAPAYPDMTPISYLGFIADIRGLKGQTRTDRLRYVVKRIGLEGVLHQAIDTLSKGYKRRVGLAQAILHDPEILILDEPTDGLDPNQKHEVRGLIREMSENKAIIISTHILEEVEAVCDRAIIIANGRILVDDTPAELEARSRYHGAVTLTVSGDDTAGYPEALRGLPGVSDVVLDPSGRITVFPANGAEISDTISAHVRTSGWIVSEQRREAGRLDDVFRELTGVPGATA